MIIIGVVVVVLVVMVVLCITRKNSSWGRMNSIFNNTTTNLNNVGGILCNNFGTEWFEAMLGHKEVSLQDTAVCAHVNRHTCTAYSYMRKDLIPMLFMFPGKEASVPCGIILDTKKVWDLITLMAVVDGDTNNRTCCTNESGSAILTRSPWSSNSNDLCVYNSMSKQVDAGTIPKKWIDGKYATFIPVKDSGATGGTCNTSCNGNQTCMYNNSGGNINQWLMNSSQDCINGKYADCYTFRLAEEGEVPQVLKDQLGDNVPDGWLVQGISPDCKSCKKPFLCVFEDAPSGATASRALEPGVKATRTKEGRMKFNATAGAEARNQFLTEGFNSAYKIVEENDRYASYIGKDGVGFQTLVSPDMQIGNMAITQCRFKRDDWNLWIDVLKRNYRDIKGLMRADNSMLSSYNYQLANPASPAYFENEVNLYIDPDTTSAEYKKQNKIWQDSIIGFYYTSSLCEEQLAPLDGVVSKSSGNVSNSSGGNVSKSSGGNVVSGVLDRCNGFYNMETDARRKWEIDRIAKARKLVYQVAKMFIKNQGRSVPIYKCTADSNAFPNWQSFTNASNGDVKLNSIFQKDDKYDGV